MSEPQTTTIAPAAAIDDAILALLRKYDQPGPRYTSYPTAPLFTTAFTAADYNRALIETNPPTEDSPISLYMHFPFCETLCYYCGCTMLVSNNRERIAEYNTVLKKEIDLLAARLARSRKVTQLHWGGGTPTHLLPEEIADMAAHINARFEFAPDAEVSVEIDPRRLQYEHLDALRKGGFNRISLGIQDFDPTVQEAVNRIQPREMSEQVVEWCRKAGFSSINLDLIYGLPKQRVETFQRTVEEVIAINPERIAVYSFAYVPWMKQHQKLITQTDLPSPEEKLALLAMTTTKLMEAGYEYIGMDHFAKTDDALNTARRDRTLHRNFQGYSTNANTDLFGLGMSSIGHFGNYYAQNAKTLPDYYRAVNGGEFATHAGYTMTQDDRVRKYMIMRLMCDLTVSKQDLENRFNLRYDEYFAQSLEKLQPLAADGLVELNPREIAVTPRGRFFLRNIAMCFDAYLPSMLKEKPIFSRTV